MTEVGLLTPGSGILGCQTPRPSHVAHQLSPGCTPRGLPPMGTRGGPQATSRSQGPNAPLTGARTSSCSPPSQKSRRPGDTFSRHLASVPFLACVSLASMSQKSFLSNVSAPRGQGAQASYLNHKGVLPVRHLQGCSRPHVGDGGAGNAQSRPRRLGREKEQDPDCWCGDNRSPPSRDSAFLPHPKGVRQVTLLSLSCPQRLTQSQELALKIPGPPRWLSGKESACQCRRHRFDP